MGLFQAIKDRFVGDLKKKIFDTLSKAKDSVLAAAKLMDLDDNKVLDYIQIQKNCEAIINNCEEAFGHFSLGCASLAKCIPFAKDLAHLAGLYYVKFGPKKPQEVLASLEAEKSENPVA